MQGFCAGHYSRTAVKGYVDAQPVRDRIDLLRSKGWSRRRLGEEIGLTPDCLIELYEAGHRVQRVTYNRIMSVPVPERAIDRGGYVSALGTSRKLRALGAIGYPQDYLAERLGTFQKCITAITRQDRVTARIWVAVDDLFRELSMTVGPSNRARVRAKNRGCFPPLAFDDIDDPDETPSLGRHTVLSAQDRIDELRDIGITDVNHLAARLGIKPESVERQLFREAA